MNVTDELLVLCEDFSVDPYIAETELSPLAESACSRFH